MENIDRADTKANWGLAIGCVFLAECCAAEKSDAVRSASGKSA